MIAASKAGQPIIVERGNVGCSTLDFPLLLPVCCTVSILETMNVSCASALSALEFTDCMSNFSSDRVDSKPLALPHASRLFRVIREKARLARIETSSSPQLAEFRELAQANRKWRSEGQSKFLHHAEPGGLPRSFLRLRFIQARKAFRRTFLRGSFWTFPLPSRFTFSRILPRYRRWAPGACFSFPALTLLLFLVPEFLQFHFSQFICLVLSDLDKRTRLGKSHSKIAL